MRLLYSVTIIAPSLCVPGGAMPRMLARESTGITFPRREIKPSTPVGMLGVRVMKGVFETSRTLNTLMPKCSAVPREKSRISMQLEPASWV